MPTTYYLWDDSNLLLEYDSGGAAVAQYHTEPVLNGNVISQRRGGHTHTFHSDALGSTTELSSEAGVATDSRRYTSFGVIVDQSGSTVYPFQFVGALGYYSDAEATLLYVRLRWFGPVLGRWLSFDRMRELADLNTFRYVGNNPINSVDPSGAAIVVSLPAGVVAVLVVVANTIRIILAGIVIAVIVVAAAYVIWKSGCLVKWVNCMRAASLAAIYCGRSWRTNANLNFRSQTRCILFHVSAFSAICANELGSCLFSWTGGWVGGSSWYSANAFKKACFPCFPVIPPPPPGGGGVGGGGDTLEVTSCR